MAFTMQVQQLTAEQRLQKAVVTIMNNPRYVALAGVLMIGSKEIRDDVPTAATNGRDEYYGRAFVDSISDAELRFVVLHECYHKLFRHLITWQYLYKKNPVLANMACDYVINLIIRDENLDGFVKLFDWICIDNRFKGMNAEQVFKILEQEQQQPQQPQQPQQGQGQGQGQPQQGQGVLDDHDWDGAQEMSAEEQGELAEQIDNAIRQGALTAGKLGTGGNRTIDSMLQPEVDWREVLREFITETCRGSDYSTYARPNRRYMSAGMYMPSGVTEKVDELVIAIDTSGSIGQPELTKFLSEVQGVVTNVNPSAVRILYWDTKVCADEVYGGYGQDMALLVESTKPAGGGGTDVNCVNKYMDEQQIKPQAVIVFTDGYLGNDWGTWNVPVLWCIADHKSAQPSVGSAVHVKL